MRGRQQICILGQKVGRSVQNIPHGRREASQLRPLEPYDASRLVLDIEAADSKFVRKYEDRQEDQTQRGPISARTSHREAKVRATLPERFRARQNPRDVPDIYRPAPIDFIRYALVDGSRKGEGNECLRRVLSRCLPPGLGKFEDHVQWLRAYQVLPYKVDQLLRIPSEQANGIIASMLTNRPKYYELSRLTTLLTRTVDGCKFVASNGPIFWHSYRVTTFKSLELQKIRRHNKIKYINAVIQRLETMRVDPGPDWYGAGLYNATKALHFPAMKRYIDIAVTKDTLKLYKPLLGNLLKTVVTWPHTITGQRRVRNIDERDLKDDLLRLLTGWESNGVREGDEFRKPSFALLLQDDCALYEQYIKALAKLEAYDALWYEFNNIDLIPISGWTSTSDESALLERAHVFARAFIRLRDPLQALKVLHKHREMRGDKDVSTPSSTETGPQTRIRMNAGDMASDENQTPPNDKLVTASRSILSIPGLSPSRRMDLLSALAYKYVTEEAHVVDEENLIKDLKRLDMYTPEYMANLVSEFVRILGIEQRHDASRVAIRGQGTAGQLYPDKLDWKEWRHGSDSKE